MEKTEVKMVLLHHIDKVEFPWRDSMSWAEREREKEGFLVSSRILPYFYEYL